MPKLTKKTTEGQKLSRSSNSRKRVKLKIMARLHSIINTKK